MATQNTIEQQLLDTLATRNFEVEKRDSGGNPTDDVDAAKTFKFDYVADSGKNYGTMVLVLDVDNDMKIMYGDNLGRTMEDQDKTEFFSFLEHLNRIATRNRYTHTTQDINQLKHTMQGIAAIKEGLFEGYYGNKIVSYSGEPTEARLMIRHSQKLGENDARYRHVESIFIETADGERFKLESRSLSAARAMLEHVRQGGKPYDIRGNHINEITREIAVLSRFNRASTRRVMEGATQEIVEQAQFYYKQLRENIKHLSTARGYKDYFETWHPATITEQDELVEDIKNLFIEQRIDSRIEEALPLLARLQKQGQDMKEIKMFESWVETLGEGTWALPDNPEAQQKLNDLMSKELIVGPDATNATEQLYDVVGDDVLFDILNDLAERSNGRANVWDDTDVQRRLQELGVQMNTPKDAMQQPAPTPPAGQPQPAAVPQQPGVAEGTESQSDYDARMRRLAAQYDTMSDDKKASLGKIPGRAEQFQQAVDYVKKHSKNNQPGVAEGAMPASVIQAKEKIRMASDEANKKRFAGKTRDELAQMARRHGYKDKNPYAKFHDGVTESTQDVAEGFFGDVGSAAVRGFKEIGKEIGLVKEPSAANPASQTPYKRPDGPRFSGGQRQVAPPPKSLSGGPRLSGGTPEEFQAMLAAQDKAKAAAIAARRSQQGVAEEINSMRKAAGLPVVESRIIDESGDTLNHVLDRFKYEVRQFEETGALDKDLYDALFDYFSHSGDIPYGIMKARQGDPREWIAQRLDRHLSDMQEGVSGKLAGAAINEGSCNMTAEGEYCPEHGLAECGYMESMGGTVAGNVGEGLLDMFRKKPRDPANFEEYMVYDTFTIFYDPTDETFIVKGTGEYENKLPTKEFPANSAMGGLPTAQAYGEYRTGGIKEPIKVNRGVINRGAHESADPMDARNAVTDSFYESEIDRLKKLASGR